jgi:RNA polymerase sigma-70 factor, ECF subfamily
MSLTGVAGMTAIDNAVRSEDATSMDAAFDRCSRAIYRYIVVRVGDAHVADDLMQQLWLQARTGRSDVPPEHHEFWLRGIAKNLVRGHWRREKRRATRVVSADPGLAAELAERMGREPLPAECLENREVQAQLLLAITELEAEEQELIIGHYFLGKAHADLARDCGMSLRAVEGRLYRARRQLREKLKRLVEAE